MAYKLDVISFQLIFCRWFDRFIILAILVNSVVLALFDYSDRDSVTPYNQMLNNMSNVLTVIFFLEAAIKILAMGLFMHSFAYLRDLWNVMDFIIVIFGIIDLMSLKINLKALRILRVLKPLRSLKSIPSMKRLIETLLTAIPQVGNAGIFVIFVVTLLAIMGLQTFTGVIYYRCRINPKPENATYWAKSPDFTRVCSYQGDGDYQCPNNLTCGSPLQYGISLHDDGVISDASIQFGIGQFDNFPQAIIAVLQALTVDGWTTIMYNISDGYTPPFVDIYFCLIVVLGHYYMLQIILGVLRQSLSKVEFIEAYEEIAQKEILVESDKQKLQEALEDTAKSPSPRTRRRKYSAANQEQGQKPLSSDNSAESITSEKSPQPPISSLAIVLMKAKQMRAKGDLERGGIRDSLEQVEYTSEKNKEMSNQLVIPKSSFGRRNSRLHKVSSMKITDDAKSPIASNKKSSMRNTLVVKDPDHELDHSKSSEVFELQSQIRGKRSRNLDDKIKSTFMWTLGQHHHQQSQQLSRGVGLAILSRMLGINQIQDELQSFSAQIKSTLKIENLTVRLKLQKQVREDLMMLQRKMELDVTKNYQTSKKSVYGIENEVHLIESVQKCLDIMVNKDDLEKGQLTFFGLKDIEQRKGTESLASISIFENEIMQLNQHMQVALKIAYNLKELSSQQDIRNFFFARFKRNLVKKNLVDKIYNEVHFHILETDIIIRTKNQRIFTWCFHIQSSNWFKITSVAIIFANAIVLSLSKYPRDKEIDVISSKFNLAFFTFFLLELCIKLIGLGFKYYFREKFNWFDSAVVVMSAIDIVLENIIDNSNQNAGAMTSLRIFRLIRVIQVAKIWSEFQSLLTGIQNTLKDISNVTILLLIMVFTYMLIGMEIYAYKVKFNEDNQIDLGTDGEYPKNNFNTLLNAFLSVFIVLANNGWTKIYFDHYRATESYGTSVFFLSIIIFGQLILINLFIAVLIENFEQLSVRTDLTNKLNKINEDPFHVTAIKHVRRVMCCRNKQVTPRSSKIEELDDDELEEQRVLKDFQQQQKNSLFIFSHEGLIRVVCRVITSHQVFEWIMLAIITVSSIQIAIDNPLNDPQSQFSRVLIFMDYALTSVFAVEALMKIIDKGFLMCGSTSYLRSWWNIIDLFVVVITLTSYGVSSKNLNSVKVFRLMKVLRPLRVISKNQGLRVSIMTLAVALPSILNVFIVSLLFYFIFGIIGVTYFQGLYYTCDSLQSSVNFMYLSQNVQSKWECLNAGGEWMNASLNFDSTSNAMFTLFVLSNLVSWSDIMFTAAAARGIDYLPGSQISSPLSAFYFVLVIIIGNFFLMNLFVGVIFTTYNREREVMGKDFMLTEEQKKQNENRTMTLFAQPLFRMKLPQSEWRQPFFFIAIHPWLPRTVLTCTLFNTLVLLLQWYGQSDEINGILQLINYGFAIIFSVEFIIKYVAFGNRYFKDNWNIFDVTIVFVTLFSILIGVASTIQIGPQFTVIRSFRMARIFHFFKKNHALKSTFQTFVVSLPALANIGSLLLLIILIYSILGVQLFAEVQLNGALDFNANFQSVGTAFITLVRTATGENWPKILEALSQTQDSKYDCNSAPTYFDYQANGYTAVGCGDPIFAFLYFCSFTLIITMVFLRLFIAIILQTFQEISDKDNKFMSNQLSDNFREVWSRYDPDATGFMNVQCLPKFLQALGTPLGWDATFENNFMKQRHYLAEITLPKHNGGREYNFMDVLENLLLIMIIRREVINFAIKHQHQELLGGDKDFLNENASNNVSSVYELSMEQVIKKQREEKEKMLDIGEEIFEDDDGNIDLSEASFKSNKRGEVVAPIVMAMKFAVEADKQRSRQVLMDQHQIKTTTLSTEIGPFGRTFEDVFESRDQAQSTGIADKKQDGIIVEFTEEEEHKEERMEVEEKDEAEMDIIRLVNEELQNMGPDDEDEEVDDSFTFQSSNSNFNTMSRHSDEESEF